MVSFPAQVKVLILNTDFQGKRFLIPRRIDAT